MATKIRLIITTPDEYLYELFGTDGDQEPMVIDKDSIDYLEDYLLEYDEDDEDDEPKMNDTDVKKMFNKIKKGLTKYKEVQVEFDED